MSPGHTVQGRGPAEDTAGIPGATWLSAESPGGKGVCREAPASPGVGGMAKRGGLAGNDPRAHTAGGVNGQQQFCRPPARPEDGPLWSQHQTHQ